jgi:outer membrane protein
MKPFQPLLACLSILFVLLPVASAQPPQQLKQPLPDPLPAEIDPKLNDPGAPVAWRAPGLLGKIISPYQRKVIRNINMADSPRLEALIRAGSLYLSLQDAIALALENNLDIEVARYGPLVADADILRTQSGGGLRGVQTALSQGPTSVLSQVSTGPTGGAATTSTTSLTSANTQGTVIPQTGSPIPTFDPQLSASMNWAHKSDPENSVSTAGVENFYYGSKNFSAALTENWATGTNAAYSVVLQSFNTNNLVNQLGPFTQGAMTLSLSQHLLQGFGLAVNTRNIRIARLNRRVSDLVFEQQVIVTVSAVVNLYWDLVSFNEDLRVKRQSLALAQKLYEDNKKQVEIGTLAKIEVARAEAEMASREQDQTVSETNVLQQEAVLKNALTRSGAATPLVYSARITPTDSLRLNLDDPIPPLPELMDTALENRPELKQTRLSIETSRIGLSGSRSQLLPTLDLQAAITNNALAGDPNYLRVGQPGFVLPPTAFVGGFGEVLAQIFRRNYPDYSVGFQLNVPLRNRLAQADYARDSLTLRQTELRERQQMNQIRVDVQNAQIGLRQIRSQYLAARKTRQLQILALDAEQKKFQLGASTIYLVIQAQRDLATAEGGEVSALANYKRAQTQMELVTGQTLAAHSIRLDEARTGSVSRLPDIPRP